jgi:hypothetical protein
MEGLALFSIHKNFSKTREFQEMNNSLEFQNQVVIQHNNEQHLKLGEVYKLRFELHLKMLQHIFSDQYRFQEHHLKRNH